MSQLNQAQRYGCPSLLSLKASALAAAITLACPLANAGTDWITTTKAIVDATTEVSSPSKVHISTNDEYPVYQNLEFAKYWKDHASGELISASTNNWQPELKRQFYQNQDSIIRAVDKAQHQLVHQGQNLEDAKKRAQQRRNELQDKYNKCAMEEDSWGDTAAGVMGILSVVHAVLGSPIAAVSLLGCSCGTYYISGVIKQMEMSRLQHALKQNDIDFDVLSNAESAAPQALNRSAEELQEARTLILENIALLNGGARLVDQERIYVVQDLSQNSRYRHMQLPVEVSSSYLEGQLYGTLVSQADDDVFIITMGSRSVLPDSQNSYKLLRSGNSFYVPVPSRRGMEYLAFSSAKDVLGFFQNLAYVHKVKQVGFINLDPLPTPDH